MIVEKSDENSFKIVIDYNKKPVKIAQLSDLHWDNPKTDWKVLKKDLDYCLENDIPIILNGDTFCLMQGAYDPRKSKDSIRPEHNTNNYLDAIIETAVDFFTPYADLIAIVCYGNHETSILKRHETDMVDRFVKALNYKAKPKTQIYKGGYSTAINYQLVYNKTKIVSYKQFLFHGSGGGGVVTRGSINLTRLAASVDNFDCVSIGHIHENKEEFISKIFYCPNNLCIKHREVLCMVTGTYKEEYKNGLSGWHVERGAPPKPIGGRILNIKIDRDQNGNKDRLNKKAWSTRFPT